MLAVNPITPSPIFTTIIMEDHIDQPNSDSTSGYRNFDSTTHRKHQAMIERLSKLHQSRLQNRQSVSSPAYESADAFLSKFSEIKRSVTDEVTRIQQSSTPLSSASSNCDVGKISAWISELEKLLAENSYHLPSYEVRASLKTISELKDSLDKLSSHLFPRKKFAFKNRPTKQNQKEASDLKPQVEKPDTFPSEKLDLVGRDTPGFRNQEGEVLEENFWEKDIGEFTVSDLCYCDVRLIGKSRTIFIHRLKNCKVYVGPVLGSVLIEDAVECIFVLASHQIRVHNAKKCDFYLRVRSRPIIEDSYEVRFAPYCLHYEGIEDDLKDSGLDEETGNWANVDDFKWLRAVQSPNWSLLPETERIGTLDLPKTDS